MGQFIKTLLSLSLAGTALGLLLMLPGRFLGKRVSSGFVYFAWLLVLPRFVLPTKKSVDGKHTKSKYDEICRRRRA